MSLKEVNSYFQVCPIKGPDDCVSEIIFFLSRIQHKTTDPGW